MPVGCVIVMGRVHIFEFGFDDVLFEFGFRFEFLFLCL